MPLTTTTATRTTTARETANVHFTRRARACLTEERHIIKRESRRPHHVGHPSIHPSIHLSIYPSPLLPFIRPFCVRPACPPLSSPARTVFTCVVCARRCRGICGTSRLDFSSPRLGSDTLARYNFESLKTGLGIMGKILIGHNLIEALWLVLLLTFLVLRTNFIAIKVPPKFRLYLTSALLVLLQPAANLSHQTCVAVIACSVRNEKMTSCPRLQSAPMSAKILKFSTDSHCIPRLNLCLELDEKRDDILPRRAISRSESFVPSLAGSSRF